MSESYVVLVSDTDGNFDDYRTDDVFDTIVAAHDYARQIKQWLKECNTENKVRIVTLNDYLARTQTISRTYSDASH